MAADPAVYPLEKYLAAAALALRADSGADSVNALAALTKQEDSGLRYWGAYGLLLRGQEAPLSRGSLNALEPLLLDSCPEVRATAAWSLLHTPAIAANARESLRSVLKDDAAAALFALNILEWTREDPLSYGDLLDTLLSSADAVYAGYLKRMVTHLRTAQVR
jgi:hypothetical protein